MFRFFYSLNLNIFLKKKSCCFFNIESIIILVFLYIFHYCDKIHINFTGLNRFKWPICCYEVLLHYCATIITLHGRIFFIVPNWNSVSVNTNAPFPLPIATSKHCSTFCLCVFLGNLYKWWQWWFSHQVMSDSCNPMDRSLPGSSVHGISQASILVWVAISCSRGSSWPREAWWNHISRIRQCLSL